jgi:hypothetical protein
LKEIFKAVEGISYEEAAEEDFDSMKYEMAEMFEEFGFDMDLEDMHSNMTQEEMIKKMLEIQDELKQQAEAKQHKRSSYKKTKKTTGEGRKGEIIRRSQNQKHQQHLQTTC